jgi:hypothetical protein
MSRKESVHAILYLKYKKKENKERILNSHKKNTNTPTKANPYGLLQNCQQRT